jgi:phytoene dehydrogenase-like protein
MPLETPRFSEHPRHDRYDAVIVGSGPNGLSAAITLARAGRSVLIVEAQPTIGGGLRSVACTLPGFLHDHCAAIHALGVASPFFQSTPLEQFGLEWIHPGAPVAHPLDDGQVVMAERTLDATCAGLGEDGRAYRALMGPLVERADALLAQTLGPFRLPRDPLLMTRFALRGLPSARWLAQRRFQTQRARALLGGMAAHSILPLTQPLTAAVGLMLCVTAHAYGWPVARGGSQQVADALARYLLSLGGEIVVNRPVRELKQLPDAKAVLFDLSPRLVSRIAGGQLPNRFRRVLEGYRHGPAAFKLDWALDGPIPWKASDCMRAGTVHVVGSLPEVVAAEQAPWRRQCAERPFLLVAQQSLFDDSRAPAGKHTGWAYCHVPPDCDQDMTSRIEAQMERFAPGFRDRILARHVTTPAAFEHINPNFIGGDIAGGVMDAWQLFTRPTIRLSPYTTPNRRLYICSASTPPGPGIHGMCGYYAAQAALRRALR